MATDRLQYIFDFLTGKNELTDEIKTVQKDSEKLAETFSGVAKTSGLAFGAFTGAIAGAVNEASKFEDIAVQFEVLTGNIEDSSRAVRSLKEFSAGTPFQFADIAQAGKQLLGFGFSVDELNTRLQKVGDVAAASGKPIEEIALIFGQVSAAGKLTGERLLQFQERAIPIGPALAETLGVAESSIKQLVSEGLVDFDTFEKAFDSLSEKGGFAFGGLSKLSETLSGKLSTLVDNFSQAAADIGEFFLPILKSGIDRVTDFIRSFRNNRPLVEFVSKFLAFGAIITGAITALATLAAGFFTLRKILAPLIPIFQALGATFVATLTGPYGIAVALGLVTLAVVDLATNWDKRIKQMGEAWETFTQSIPGPIKFPINVIISNFSELAASVIRNLAAIISVFEEVGQAIKDTFSGINVNFLQVAQSQFKTFAAVALDTVSKVAGGFSNLFGAFGNNALTSAFDQAQVSLRIFAFEAAKGSDQAEGLIDKNKKAVGILSGGLLDLAKEFQNYGKVATDANDKVAEGFVGIDKIVDKIKKKAKDIVPPPDRTTFEKFQDFFNGLGESLKEGIEKADFKTAFASATPALISSIAKGAEGAKQFVKTALVSAATAIYEPLGQAVGPIIDLLQMSEEQLRTTIDSFVKALPQVVIQMANNGPVIVESMIRALPEFTRAFAVGMVQQFADPAFRAEMSKAIIAAVIESVPGIAEGFARGIRDGFKNSLEGLKDLFSGSLADTIVEGFKKGFEKLQDLISKFNPINLFSKLFKIDSSEGKVEKFIGLDFPGVSFSKGGQVGGVPKVFGDSNLNDNVLAFLSPGEGVLPRSVMRGGIPAIIDFAKKTFGMAEGGTANPYSKNDLVDFYNSTVGQVTGEINPEQYKQKIDSLIQASQDVYNDIKSGNVTGAINTLIASAQAQYDTFGEKFFEEFAKLGLPFDLIEIIRTLRRMGASIDVKEFVENPFGVARNAVKSLVGTTLRPFFRSIIKKPFGGAEFPTPDFNGTGSVNVGTILKGLQNGGVIPNGFPNDSFPAGLTSGELVVPRQLTSRLDNFITNQESRSNDLNSVTNVLLTRVIELLERPITAETQISIDQREFADLLLQINRTNQRVA